MSKWTVSVSKDRKLVNLVLSSDDDFYATVFTINPKAATELGHAFAKAAEECSKLIINPTVRQ